MTFLLIGCGGGGGSSNGSSPVVVPPARTTPLYFGYYGDIEGQAAETADHVNLAFIPSWGATITNHQVITDRMVALLNEAKASRIPAAVVDLSFVLWSQDATKTASKIVYGHQKTLNVLSPTAEQDVRAMLTQLQTAGMAGMIIAFYIADEPDLNGMSDAQMIAATTLVRRIAQEFFELRNVKMWSIYSDHGMPGITVLDGIGHDNYGIGAGVLSWYNSLPATASKILIVGCANPWRTDPTPFIDYAIRDTTVAAVLGFMWLDGGTWEGQSNQQGCRSNGLAPAYRAAGLRVLGKS